MYLLLQLLVYAERQDKEQQTTLRGLNPVCTCHLDFCIHLYSDLYYV